MVDVFLIVATTVAFFILLVIAVYLLVYYSHPDDHNEAYFPKIVVIIGIMLAGATCLLLPLDVANGEGYPGTFEILYYINFIFWLRRNCTVFYVINNSLDDFEKYIYEKLKLFKKSNRE